MLDLLGIPQRQVDSVNDLPLIQRPDNSLTNKSSLCENAVWAGECGGRSVCFHLRRASSRPEGRVRPRRRPAPTKAANHKYSQHRDGTWLSARLANSDDRGDKCCESCQSDSRVQR